MPNVSETARSFWTANKGKVIALVVVALLSFLGYKVGFEGADAFLEQNTPATTSPATP